MSNIIYREPGAGAVDFAQVTIELIDVSDITTRDDLLALMHFIMTHKTNEKRVKRCDFCGYQWYDDSLRNTRKTCSSECKTGIKTLQRAKQRETARLIARQVRKKTKRELNYYYWFEYPFWLSEYEMLKQSWKYEVPYDAEFMSVVDANNQIYGVGNRRVDRKSVKYEDSMQWDRFNQSQTRKLLSG